LELEMLLSRCFKEDSDDTESLMLLNVPLSGRNGVAMAEGNVQAASCFYQAKVAVQRAIKLLLRQVRCRPTPPSRLINQNRF
jgi:hypothetical protein